jgi:hypothetical protein
MTNRIDQTNAAEYIDTAKKGRLGDIADLLKLSGGDIDYEVDAARAREFGIDDGDYVGDQADELLSSYPLCVETQISFEIVIGTGGPDDRLIVECDVELLEPSEFGRFGDLDVSRILYRYSWDGSAERVLGGEDREVAEAFARRVVPELAD